MFDKTCWLGVFLLALALLTGCSSGPPLKGGAVTVVNDPSALTFPDLPELAPARDRDYRIGPQDLVDVTVFGVPDLTRTARVDAQGRISLPLAGTVLAAGRTVQELEAAIAQSLGARYLQAPQVSVFVKEAARERVTVGGSVVKPGIYPINGESSLLQVIALSQGLDPLANEQGVVIFRRIDGRKMAAVFDMRAISQGVAADPPVYGGDVVMVDQSGSKTALRHLIEVIPAFALFSPYLVTSSRR